MGFTKHGFDVSSQMCISLISTGWLEAIRDEKAATSR
jgi:hypothetical protein